MSHIGESRKHTDSPWHSYVCLDEDDCRLLLKAVESLAKKKEKAYLKWVDIHDGGEMTDRQQTAMLKAENAYDKVEELQQNITTYLKYADKRKGGEK